MKSSAVNILFVIVPLIGAAQLYAQQGPVKWTVKADPKTQIAGNTISLQVTATIAEGWHIYALRKLKRGPIATSLDAGEGYALAGPIKAPKPATKFDSSFKMNVGTYSGTVLFEVPLKPASTVSSSDPSILVYYQACNSETCLMPKTVPLRSNRP